MVVTTAPSHCNASIVHDFTATPFTCTTQAPHWVVSQPTCVPVSPSCSLKKATSNVRPSTVPWTARPFTAIETSGIGPVLPYRVSWNRLANALRATGLSWIPRGGQTLAGPLERVPHAQRRHRHRNVSDAERREGVQNGVHDRRCRADRRALTGAPDPERVRRGRDLGMAGLERRQVARVWHRIIAESAHERNAGHSMDDRFHEGLTDSLGRSAVYLTVDEQGVDDATAVVNDDVPQQREGADFGVDFHDGHMRSIVEGDILGIEEIGLIETGRHTERQIVGEVRFAGDIGEGQLVGAARHGRKLEAGAPLENDGYSSLRDPFGRMRDR